MFTLKDKEERKERKKEKNEHRGGAQYPAELESIGELEGSSEKTNGR